MTPGSECAERFGAMQRDLSGLNIYDVLADCYHGYVGEGGRGHWMACD